MIEVTCDPSREVCFQRDCSNPDNCPPDGFSDFKRYSLHASDFKMCLGEDCKNACETGIIKCQPVQCAPSPDDGESCSTIENQS